VYPSFNSSPQRANVTTVQQIYPASYKDSNHDGLGDISGIVSKLDYIACLGVDAIWVSPMYDSPQHDMGYDIRNYEEVYKPYGTVVDMEQLLHKAHELGMRVLLDLVINHTSHEHAWFKESRSSKDSPKRDWYIWRPPRKDAKGERIAPNNWRSNFNTPAWTFDEATGEYYLHLFTPEQPDLNWENEDCRNALYDSAMHFWLKKGVDGFRIDTCNMYSKSQLEDADITDPNSFTQPAHDVYCNGPRMHEFLREMNEKVLDKYGAITVGELPNTPDPAHVLRYVSESARQLNMVFQFDVVDLGMGAAQRFDHSPHELSDMKKAVTKWQQFIAGTDGWTTAFCENHDQGRSVSRYTSDHPQFRQAAAKMLATMLGTMTGTLFIYQGQEIGMINAPPGWEIEAEYKDIDSRNYYQLMKERYGDDEEMMKTAIKGLHVLARDHARLPMQWDDTPHAGFTREDVVPWMRAHDAYPHINVEEQEKDSDSVLSHWKKMLSLRKQHREVFIHGEFVAHDIDNEQTFVYSKHFGEKAAVVVLNFTAEKQSFKIPVEFGGEMRLVHANTGIGEGEMLVPYEARIYLVGE
jgi:oligo-1,6-glucosidase